MTAATLPRSLARPLVLSDRVRWFRFGDRDFLHTSAVPLAYVGCSPALRRVLARFTDPARVGDVLPGVPSAADLRFVETLCRVGVLQDAETPDPVHALTGDRAATRVLYLYPTNSCNLRCVYCYATSGPGAGPRLSREHALIAVDDFFDTLDEGVRSVTLKFHGGGEPTTNFAVMLAAWDRFNRRATDLGLRATATTITNGTFGPAVLRQLQELGWPLTVSYDGPRQAAQRPTAADRDSRARVVANIRALRAAGVRLGTRATLTRHGLGAPGAASLRSLVDDAAEVGIARVQVEPASMVGRGADLDDGHPDPIEFAEAFLDGFRYALGQGVALSTSAWSHPRVGDGRYCGAIDGGRALTPDGAVSACTEVCDGGTPDDPFVIGRLDPVGRRLEIWPVREQRLRRRVGHELPHCRTCFMVDTCGGGCAAHARAQSGDAFARDEVHCVMSRRINPELMADLVDGRLLPDDGWQPIEARLSEGESAVAGAAGRLVALVPPFARARWNADPQRRPLVLPPRGAAPFFHLPPTA